jgi:hypothetical protein
VGKSKLGVLSVIALLLFSLSTGIVIAQYSTEKITYVTLGSDGVFNSTESDIDVSYVIRGAPGAVGSVTVVVYSGNPQATASVPEGMSLGRFVAISFDMSASDFSEAQIIIGYTDGDVANIDEPYTIYKYLPGNDSFVELPTTEDASAKTLTVTLSSVDDPLLAVGGLTVEASLLSADEWIIVSVATIAIFLMTMVIVILWRRDED